jgi:phenylacetate-CoA ligase
MQIKSTIRLKFNGLFCSFVNERPVFSDLTTAPARTSVMLRTIYRRLAIPLVDLARRTDSISEYRRLDRSQWATREELHEVQMRRLRELLIHAAAHVPYYGRIFAECGLNPASVQSVEDIQSLPFLNKEIIRRERGNLLADDAPRYQPRPHRSAGTTGQPIIIQMDRRRHSIAWADMYRWWNAGGWQLGDKQFVIAGAALHPRQVSGFRARLYGKLNRFEEFTSFDLTPALLDRALRRLSQSKPPVYVRGYASSVYELAQRAAEVRWTGHVDAVFTTAEMLFPQQRARIEDSLRTRVFDQWGCRDGGISAFECDHHRCLHLAVENAVVEVIRDGRPASPGQSGEVVATDLFSYAMPIIRYKVGDWATMSSESCACGRGLPLVASVEGRVSGFLIGSDGRRIHGEFFSHVFWGTPWVRQFQVVQDDLSEIVVRIVPEPMPSKEAVEEVRALMQQQAGPHSTVRIEFVDDIPPGPMGKRQFIVCRVPSP